jgi:amino acid adenylation domain-containing protein/thioester reductase-like protein
VPSDLLPDLPEIIAARAAGRPDAVAMIAGEERISYRELEARAERLARGLRKLGVGPEVLVGVLLERSAAAVAVLLAIWKCGGAALPLDPENPAERRDFILGEAKPRLVVTEEALAGLEAGGPGGGPALLPDSPAYVIYTSGSTGAPKGIVVSHRSLANRILWAATTEMGPDDAFLHKTTLTFDVSLAEIFVPLAAGGRCVLARPGGQRDLDGLAGLIARESITHASFPPAALRLLLEVPDAAARLASLRLLITGGETVPPDLPARVKAVLPGAVLYNRYGPTEATISVLTGACDPASRAEIVPLGQPIAGARIHLVGEEIQIGGVCLARGYLNRPGLTAESFVPDPFGGGPGERLYRTGDRARRGADGAVEFLGRIDDQVKIRGFRVEIGEVEAALGACPGVREAAVVAPSEAATGSRRLVAWVVPEDLDVQEVRRFLAGRLPAPMVPSALVPCAELPRMLSGKVDRAALLQRAASKTSEAAGGLLGLLEELLQVPVGEDDNLLELGLHSLLLVRLQARLRDELGVEVALADIVREPTAGALARRIESGERGAEIGPRELEAEAALDLEIRPSSGNLPRVPETILLTGATGFLGSHLLDELLARTPARVLCLVRAAKGLRETERVAAVPGDLGLPRLGLSEAAFGELAGSVDAIYHCGAQVRYDYPYEALRAVNAGGTRELLRLAAQGRPKAFHHVSTLSVLREDFLPEGPLAADASGVSGGYAQSKWVAERLVQTALDRGLPGAIYRPGWITGDNPDDFLMRLIQASLESGLAPDLGPIEVCPTPVEWVAAAIVRLSLRPEAGGVFHLINPNPVAYESALARLPVAKVPVERWAAALAENTALAAFAGAVSQPRRFQPLRFESARARAALAGFECPPVDPLQLIPRMPALRKTGAA